MISSRIVISVSSLKSAGTALKTFPKFARKLSSDCMTDISCTVRTEQNFDLESSAGTLEFYFQGSLTDYKYTDNLINNVNKRAAKLGLMSTFNLEISNEYLPLS